MKRDRQGVLIRRLLAFMGVSLALVIVCIVMGWPPGWVTVPTSFMCAELVRRIASEGNPGKDMSWLAILKYGFSCQVDKEGTTGATNTSNDAGDRKCPPRADEEY